MNQILAVKKVENKSKKLNVNQTIKIFCFAIIIFGMILLASGSYAIYNDITLSKVESVPVAQIERTNNEIKITIKHDKEISTVTYNWNNGQDYVIQGNGRNYIEEVIQLPVGNNTLNVAIVDILGKETRYQKEYIMEDGDITKPEIDLVLTGTTLSITATDNEEMAYITYRWNDEEETKVEAEPATPGVINTEIDIKEGLNTLTIIAVDKNNNTQTRTQPFEGVQKPVINVRGDGYKLIVEISHNKGINKVDFVFNGQKGYLAEDMLGGTYIVFNLRLIEGDNTLSLTVQSVDNTIQEFSGICPN